MIRVGILLVFFASPIHAPAQQIGNSAQQIGNSAQQIGDPAQQVGRASCASATCHGGVVDRGPVWNHSLTKWLSVSPHTGAGLLLLDADSRAIVVALEPEAANSPLAFDRVLRKRCIGCHTSATPEQCRSDAPLDEQLLAEGVSCQSCHGAAEDWLKMHIRSDWSGDQRYGQTGFSDTESIIGRTKTCVACHIGSRETPGAARDMNHDLIAAGHPALRFDLLIYNENLPKHWDLGSASEKRFNESAIRVRRTSRATGLAAAARLAAQRAEQSQSDAGVPWPELSDYDCFACHQSLSIAEYRLPEDEKSKHRSPLRISAGLPIWNAWHTIGLKELSNRNLEALAPNRIARSPKTMASAAMNVVQQYESKAQVLDQQQFDPSAELARLRSNLQSSPPRDWHEAAVQYLDADAILRDLGKPLSPLHQRVEPLLRFDRDGEIRAFDSPVRFDPDEFQKTILTVLPQDADGDVAVSSAGETLP